MENFESLKAKKLKKKRKSQIAEVEVEPEQEVQLESVPKKNKKKKKSPEKKKEEKPKVHQELEEPAPNATPKFGRRSKGEVNNNTLSSAKSDKGGASSSTKETAPSYLDTSANYEFQSPTKKLKFTDEGVQSNKKKKKSHKEREEEQPQPGPSVENAFPKFGRRSKEEIDIAHSPAKWNEEEGSDSSFALSKVPQIKKRKAYADETASSDLDTTSNYEFSSPAKKLKFGDGDLLEESKRLLSVASNQITHDATPYSKALQSLNYEKIAEHFPNMTAEDCKSHLMILIEGTVKIKCLHQLLHEALEDIQKDKTIKSSFSKFFHLHSDTIDKEFKQRGGKSTKITIAAELWKKLSPKEKRAYQPDRKRKSDAIGETPIEVFLLSLIKKNKESNMKDARQQWNKLTDKKKIKYIKKSAKRMMNEMSLTEEHQKQRKELHQGDDNDDDEEMENLDKRIKGPSKEEANMYLKHVDYPDEPTTFLPLYYFDKKNTSGVSPKNRLMTAIRMFKELNKEMQDEWSEKHQKYLANYSTKFEEWKAKQDDVTLFIVKTYKKPAKKKERKEKENEKKSKGVFKIADYIKQLHYAEISCGMPKFLDEPVVPPLSPQKVFCHDYEKKKGVKLTSNQLKEMFDALDKSQKLAFKAKSEKIKEIYINGLKDYVREMGEDQRRLFLGVKRIRYIRLFGKDIFEDDYPNAKYKVYTNPAKKSKQLKPKVNKSAKPEILESNEEVEEEEDELEDFKLPSSSKSEKQVLKNLPDFEVSDEEDEEDDEDDDYEL